MAMHHWIRKLSPFLTFFIIRKGYQRRVSLIKIEAAKAYVLGVKKVRFLLLGSMLALFSLTLFACGLLLIHTALFAYSSWSVQTKFLTALLLGALEVLISGGILFYLLSDRTWVKFSGIKHVLKAALKKE